jgi:hypothetical protein
MKQGLDIVALAQEIQRQQAAKQDIVASTSVMRVEESDQGLRLKVNGDYDFGINDLARKQMAEHFGVPAKYAEKMQAEAPGLFAQNMNAWIERAPSDQKRLVRTMDGSARAFLSNAYRPLDYAELAEAVLPPLMDLGVQIISSQITETRMYIKAVDERIKYDVPAGRAIGDGSHVFFRTNCPAIVISNSEVGMGGLSVETSILDKMCTNLAILGTSIRKTHLGARLSVGDDLAALLTDKTRKLSDAALWSQVQDVVRAAFDEARFKSLVEEKIVGMTKQPITGPVVEVVEFGCKKLGITNEGERASVLENLIKGSDLTRFGFYNAITRTAEDITSYDRATDFERLGSKVIELSNREWQEIANPLAQAA